MKEITEPKDYKQFVRAIELCDQLQKECPKVSVLHNCHINLSELKKDSYLFRWLGYNVIDNKEGLFITRDKQRKYLLLDSCFIDGKIKTSKNKTTIKSCK